MKLDNYQRRAAEFDLFRTSLNFNDPGFLEKVLGLVGEAGETADKVKKIIRDKGGYASKEDREAIMKELGDVLWYIANISRYLGFSLSDVSKTNLEKLEDRLNRDKLHGSGDNR